MPSTMYENIQFYSNLNLVFVIDLLSIVIEMELLYVYNFSTIKPLFILHNIISFTSITMTIIILVQTEYVIKEINLSTRHRTHNIKRGNLTKENAIKRQDKTKLNNLILQKITLITILTLQP